MNAPTNRPIGLFLDMSMEAYQAVDALSSTGMRLLSRSAWHYRNRVATVPTRPMLNGTLAHCAVLEPHAMAERYIVVPEGAPKRPSAAQWSAKKSSEDSMAAKEWWTNFNADAVGREIVAAEDYAITQAQLLALQADDEIADLLSSGYGEPSVFWIDAASGVYCKARPDWVRPLDSRRVKLLDLKSTADESPDAFGRVAARLSYHRQRAHYIEGFRQATGLEVVDFVFAAVSSAPPVLAVPYRLVDEVAQQGEEECAELRAQYAECLHTNRWPAYPPSARVLDFPKWAKPNKEIEVSFVD